MDLSISRTSHNKWTSQNPQTPLLHLRWTCVRSDLPGDSDKVALKHSIWPNVPCGIGDHTTQTLDELAEQ